MQPGSNGFEAKESRDCANRRRGSALESLDESDERKAQETLYLLREAEAAAGNSMRGEIVEDRVAEEAITAIVEATDKYDVR